MLGLVATGWMWLRMAHVAVDRTDAFHAGKVKTARFYFTKVLPQVNALSAMIAAGSTPVMDVEL
jgi:Acetyl-CoA dehydrogenase C-terminal like